MELKYEKEFDFTIEEIKEVIKLLSLKVLVIFFGCAAIMFGLGIYYLFRTFEGEFNSTTSVCSGVLIGVAIAYVIIAIRNYKKAIRRAKGSEKYGYKFYDEHFVLTYVATDSNATIDCKYEDVKKCVKKSKYLLFIVDRNAFVLRYNELDKEFIDFLKSKIKKFKD